jgi:SPOR domain
LARTRLAASKPVTTVCFVCHATGLGTFTHQLDRILPVAVPQSGLAPPYTQRRPGSGRLTTYVYANLSGLELPDRAQRRREDHRICRWHGPPSRSSQPVALESSVPWSFPLSLSLDLRAALPSGTITATATHRAATGERSVQWQWPRLIQRPALGNGRLSSLRLIDLALASEGGCFWVFHLEPLIRAASAVRRAKPLGQPLFELLQAKYPNQLSGHQPIIRRADLDAAGICYRALVGPFASAEKAAKMCSGLKAAGADCISRKTDVSPAGGPRLVAWNTSGAREGYPQMDLPQ